MAECSEMAGDTNWKEQCMTLETQMLKFRVQASKIRELLAEKMQQLERQVMEANRRADKANQQVRVMEEKLNAANIQTSESENKLYKNCQGLEALIVEKDDIIQRLELQLGEQKHLRIQEAKVIEEKAAKIKDWVTMKLQELETENQSVKFTNQQQMEHIQILQTKLQALTGSRGQKSSSGLSESSGEAQRLSSLTFGYFKGNPQSLQQNTLASGVLDKQFTGKEMNKRSCTKAAQSTENDERVYLQNNCVSEGGKGLINHQLLPKEAATTSMTLNDDSSDEAVRRNQSKSKCWLNLSAHTAEEAIRLSQMESDTYLTASDDSSTAFDDDCDFERKLPSQDASAKTESLKARDYFPNIIISKTRNKKMDHDCSSDELNKKFQSQRLDSSSREKYTPNLILTSTPTTTTRTPPTPSLTEANSFLDLTPPRLRAPNIFGTSVTKAKKHCSQPQLSTDRLFGRNRNAVSMMKPMEHEETDIDIIEVESGILEKMETGYDEGMFCYDSIETQITEEQPCNGDTKGKVASNKPPTPPLHRFPSWVTPVALM